MALGGELGSSTSGQLAGVLSTVLVPVGSTEQHGPHLPLDTDTRIADAVAREMAVRLGDADSAQRWLVAPAIGYGSSAEHQSFPGTISIGSDVLTQLLIEYARSASCWAQRVVFVNGHGGNVAALRSAVSRIRFEGRDAAWVPCSAAGSDAHAGHAETSVLLYLSPSDVRTEHCQPGNRAPLNDLLPAMRRGGVVAVSEVGILGDPTTATAAEGRRLFTEMVEGCVRGVHDWAPTSAGMLQ